MASRGVARSRAMVVGALVLGAGCTGGSPDRPTEDAAREADLGGAIDLLDLPDAAARGPAPPPLHAGPVLDALQLVTITYAGFPDGAALHGFGGWVLGSAWYAEVGADYGLGPGAQLAAVALNEAAPEAVTDGDVQEMLAGWVRGLVVPAPSRGPARSQLVYLIDFPGGTHVVRPGGAPLCDGLPGYHGALVLDGAWVTYAVVGDCGGGVDELTRVASHELIDVATDPWAPSEPSFVVAADFPDHWSAESGAEVADLCDRAGGVREAGYFLGRVFSPRAAAAPGEPCVPSPLPSTASGGPFETVLVTPAEAPVLRAGQRFSFVLRGWAGDPRMAAWTTSIAGARNTEFPLRALAARLSSTAVAPATTVRLDITVPHDATPGQIGAIEALSGPNVHLAPIAFRVE